MTDDFFQKWLQRSNEMSFSLLEGQARSTLGLVPFVGAGMSRNYGFKDWKNILLEAAPPYAIGKVSEKLALPSPDYEGAAEVLFLSLGSDGFQNTVTALSGDHLLSGFDTLTGYPTLLPLIAGGPVVTTNFDGVLERIFMEAGEPFEAVISGPRPDLTVLALHQNRHVLIKLHGDWQDRVGRTFAKSDYDTNYGTVQPTKKRELLDGVERLLFSSRSMLFLGASLYSDRTVQILKDVNRTYAGIRHFAILSAPEEKDLEERERQLRECGVAPLWYRPASNSDRGQQVQQLLQQIIERMSVKLVAPGSTIRRVGKLIDLLASADPEAPEVASHRRMPESDEVNVHFDRVTGEVERGTLVFFLGSAIHTPTQLMADQFYARLAKLFGCTELDTDNFAIAQFIADRHGRETLDNEIQRFFGKAKPVSRVTHDFFVNWDNYNAKRAKPLPYPTVLTTNYDDVLERSLTASNVSYHLFSYQATGLFKGLFYHRRPNGELRIIERPKNITSIEPGIVVVKLNGGMDFRGEIPSTFVTTRLDYLELAARIPDVLPAVIAERLSASRLLFLGHGLVAPDVETIIRFAHLGRPVRSWAVTLKEDHHKYWQQCGIEIHQYDVNAYMQQLREELTRQA